MRVLVAPDSFGGSLSAQEAAEAMAEGWLTTKPDDHVVGRPLSDGGPGFVAAVATALMTSVHEVWVTGPRGEKVLASFAMKGDQAWIEAASACGLHLISEGQLNPRTTTSFGVGELIQATLALNATHITIGLGGTGTNDGGAGMLSALGATSQSAPLNQGGSALTSIADINLDAVRTLLEGVTLVAASDVDNPLLGLRGATATFARQKGADDFAVMELETALANFSAVCGRRVDGKDASVALGAGAAGGLGFALIHLGAQRVSGISTVMEILGIEEQIRLADLVITGEGCLDDQTLHGKVVTGVAQLAAKCGVPCVALAGEVRLGKREISNAGIDSAYAMKDLVGAEVSLTQPASSLRALTARVAKSWGRA
jgi:glycerate 2-kinase